MFAQANNQITADVKRAVAKVERAPSESSDGFSALGSQYSGGSDETDMTVATDAILDDLSTFGDDDDDVTEGTERTPQASTSCATSALGIEDMSDLASQAPDLPLPSDVGTEALLEDDLLADDDADGAPDELDDLDVEARQDAAAVQSYTE